MRNHKTAKHFFKKALQSFHVSKTCMITVDKKQLIQLLLKNWSRKKDSGRHPNKTTHI